MSLGAVVAASIDGICDVDSYLLDPWLASKLSKYTTRYRRRFGQMVSCTSMYLGLYTAPDGGCAGVVGGLLADIANVRSCGGWQSDMCRNCLLGNDLGSVRNRFMRLL